jgi:ubiquinone biosynthesis protein
MQRFLLTTGRLVQLAWGCLRYILLPIFLPETRRPPAAVRARNCIEYLGGAWTKVGQALALRFDLLPTAYCNEFLKLLNEATAFPYEVARAIIREDLGDDPEVVFASFDPVPLAAASIGQVHVAVARDGKRLAVKVQRPHVAELFAADFSVMRLFASLLDLIGALSAISARAFVDEFSRWTEEEIDYRTEARNAHRAWLFSCGDSMQTDAKVRFEYSTRRVIATEMLDGICLLEIIRAVREADSEALGRFAAAGHDIHRIGRNIAWNLYNQMFRDGYFHADLHPANLFILKNDVIGYVDYGIVGRLSEEVQSSLRIYIRGLLLGNFEAATNELLRWIVPSLTTDIDQARRELLGVLEDHRFGRAGEVGTNEPQITSSFIIALLGVLRKHELTPTQSLTLYFKATLTADMVVFQLAPDFNVSTLLLQFFKRELMLDLREGMNTTRILQETWAFKYQTQQMLMDFGRIQDTGRSIETSLEMLRTTLIYYGVCAGILGVAAYLFGRMQAFAALFSTVGIDEVWAARILYAGACVLAFLTWRQGRKVKLVLQRRTVARQEMFDRSLGASG